jgi:ATP-dependent Clp protease adaptor protein ClpS
LAAATAISKNNAKLIGRTPWKAGASFTICRREAAPVTSQPKSTPVACGAAWHPYRRDSTSVTMMKTITAHVREIGDSAIAPADGALAMANKPRPRGPNGPGGGDDEGRTGLVTKTRPKTKKPSLYKVLLLNDDYTPMEFVIHVLEKYFSKGREEATRIMLHVHQKGVGVCGVFTYEVAETKVTQVMDVARQNGHPLQCTMEKE